METIFFGPSQNVKTLILIKYKTTSALSIELSFKIYDSKFNLIP